MFGENTWTGAAVPRPGSDGVEGWRLADETVGGGSMRRRGRQEGEAVSGVEWDAMPIA